jgi:PhzF family phenazine biosynthesis protein
VQVEKLKQLAQVLVNFFYPLLEISLFSYKGKIIEILNPFSSSREEEVVELESLMREGVSHKVLSNGKQVKQVVYFMRGEEGNTGCFLRFRYDTTQLQHLKDHLDLMLQRHFQQADKDVNEWQENIDQLIGSYLKIQQVTIQSATGRQKRELISLLYGKKLFEFKEASIYIAAKMQLSRATIYNYLKTISTFRQIQIHRVDAFTDKNFGGNPAGVVLEAEELDEATMRKITRELNLSETAFVLPSQKADFRLRYFTPTGHEINFCGHSTVGALYMIAKEKKFGIQRAHKYVFHVETLSGILKMEVAVDKEGKIKIAYETPSIRLKKSNILHEEVAKAAGFDLHLVDKAFPVMYEETNKDLFICIKSLADLKKIECDLKALTHFSKQHDIVVLCLICSEPIDRKNQFHMRCFAPLVGISEDPFTGSVLGGLVAYVDTFGLLQKGSHSFRVEQGHFIERPGVVKVQFSKKKGIYRAKALASAVHCFSTEINLAQGG